MAKSTITRERVVALIAEHSYDSALVDALEHLLSAMDSEPVAIIDQANLDYLRSGADADVWPPEREEMGDVLLYRHAQPAPVAYSDFESFWSSYIHPLAQDDELKGFAWDIWCAAMLQAGKSSAHVVDRPVAWHHTAKSKEENHSNCCFSYSPSHDFGPRYEKPQSQPHYLPERLDYDRALHFLSTEPRKVTPETVIGGSSPVIPDGWTGNDKANAALMMLDRIETVDPVDDDRIDGIKRIVRELAAAPHDTPALNSVQSVVTVPGKWIPVSERMPENDGAYLCWDNRYVTTYAFIFGAWQANQFIAKNITHWMPLPAGPQEVR